MFYTLKEIKTAILVLSALYKNTELPESLRETLFDTRKELVEYYITEKEKDKNVSGISSEIENKTSPERGRSSSRRRFRLSDRNK